MTWWKLIGFSGASLAAVSLLSSAIHPWGDVRSVAPGNQILEGSAVPGDVRRVFENKCADCHSNQTHWPLYSRVAPVSWLVEHDVQGGRAAMNLSLWAGMGAEDRIALLARISAEARSGEMPPRPYAMMHAAYLSDTEKQEVVTWARAERKRIRSESPGQKEQK